MRESLFYVRGFNPPVRIVKPHPIWKDMVWVVPASLPWASASAERLDELEPELRNGGSLTSNSLGGC